MNILLVTSAVPLKSPFSTNEKLPPLGVGFLMSILKNIGHNVFFIDNYLKPTNFIIEGYLQKNKIDFIGIYANTICYRDTLRMFNEIEDMRQKGLWQGKIMVGGPHTTVALDTIPSFVDYVVQGEGEKAIVGIVEGKINQRVIREERIKDLDSIPFQPWETFSKLSYDSTCPWMDIEPVFTLNTSRGCPFNCSFCSVESVWGNKYTFFSADRVISEIEYLKKNYGVKGIYFREDNFTLNINRTKEFCNKLIEKNVDIHWACETRVDNLSEELISLMGASGCRAFYLGIESCSPRMLEKLNKKIKIEQIENTIAWGKKYNIRSYCSLIVGTPEDTFEDYLITKKMMKKFKPYAYTFNVFVGIPNSPLYQYILKNNLYEYRDDLDLLYLPGFDIKTRFFYNMDSKCYVDYDFKKKTDFDRKLLKILYRRKLTRKIVNILDAFFPGRMMNFLRKIKHKLEM